MALTRVLRPIVRSFTPAHLREASAHVRAGGHAIVWETPSRARLYFRTPKKDDVGDLGYWAVLDLGKTSHRRVRTGPMRGLSQTPVPADANDIVRGWCVRDSVHPGALREVAYDCLACGACCKDNAVELDEADLERFREGRLDALGKPPLARRRKGKLVLTLLANGRCRQLRRDNTCKIYPFRPGACRDFPVGSECCLFAREDGLGEVDGATA